MRDHEPNADGTEHGIAPPGFRLPPGARPGRVRLQVSDLGRSLAYYEGILGLRVLDQGDGEATLGAGSDGRSLIELEERPGARRVARHGRLGLYHFALLLPDRAALGRFVRHLEGTDVRAGAADHLVSEALYLTDPDGLGIEVYADRPRSEWRYDGRELLMTTEPLDVEAVAAEAGGSSWTGMPPGTTMGHLHLHVGDLEEAAGFYHGGLGLAKTVWGYPGALFLSAGGYHHHLGLNVWAAGAPRPGPDDARLLEWELVVPTAADADDALESVEAAGHGVERAPAGGGGVATDPWGTPVRVRAG